MSDITAIDRSLSALVLMYALNVRCRCRRRNVYVYRMCLKWNYVCAYSYPSVRTKTLSIIHMCTESYAILSGTFDCCQRNSISLVSLMLHFTHEAWGSWMFLFYMLIHGLNEWSMFTYLSIGRYIFSWNFPQMNFVIDSNTIVLFQLSLLLHCILNTLTLILC